MMCKIFIGPNTKFGRNMVPGNVMGEGYGESNRINLYFLHSILSVQNKKNTKKNSQNNSTFFRRRKSRR